MAKFELCSCGKHGHILLETGLRGPEFCFKEFGLHVVRAGAGFGLLNDDEVTQVMRAIQISPLPQSAQEADATLIFSAELFNQLGDRYQGMVQLLPAEVVHDLLHGELKQDEVPSDLYEKVTELFATTRPH